jgi:hypothetical protein
VELLRLFCSVFSCFSDRRAESGTPSAGLNLKMMFNAVPMSMQSRMDFFYTFKIIINYPTEFPKVHPKKFVSIMHQTVAER